MSLATDIRRIRSTEGAALREVRLRALASDPQTFESTYVEEAARPANFWDQWAAASATGGRACLFVADRGDGFDTMAGAYTPDATPRSRGLIAMWVDPELRNRGIGRGLAKTIVQ